ncbi:MAG: pyridoxamine 5'-phosphate oxidase [Caldilinea sp. CFX5]|nr:pyridoxamine 5'-phosphate oxidase [Caldilinea sp. CFX5]
MNSATQQSLAQLIRTKHTAALGTLYEGAPLVSLVLYLPNADFTAFYLHLSWLAQHTQAILGEPQVSLMIAEPDTGQQDPQTLARVSLQGVASIILPTDAEYEAVRAAYLQRFPTAAMTVSLGDFAFYRVTPSRGRFVAGFGQIFNLTKESLQAASTVA